MKMKAGVTDNCFGEAEFLERYPTGFVCAPEAFSAMKNLVATLGQSLPEYRVGIVVLPLVRPKPPGAERDAVAFLESAMSPEARAAMESDFATVVKTKEPSHG